MFIIDYSVRRKWFSDEFETLKQFQLSTIYSFIFHYLFFISKAKILFKFEKKTNKPENISRLQQKSPEFLRK